MCCSSCHRDISTDELINNHSSKSGDRQRGATGKTRTTSKPTTTAKFPSGLVPNWQTKVSKASASHSTQDHKHAESPLGGLVDDDAYAEQSHIPDHKLKSRKNDVGFILTSNVVSHTDS